VLPRSHGSPPEHREAGKRAAPRGASNFFAKLAPSCPLPSALAGVGEKLGYAQPVIPVDYNDFSTRDQFAVEKQIDGFLHLLIELHNTARAKIEKCLSTACASAEAHRYYQFHIHEHS
jgi:hypothetical protein